MVRSRGESPPQGDASLLPASVPDIGLLLRLARERVNLTLPEAAVRAGLASSQLESLESGSAGRQHDRIATLRALRTYANSLGLPGDDYVLVAVEGWPTFDPSLNPDTAVVPVISISSAPAGGHSPAGGSSSAWPGDMTGVPDAATGVIGSVAPLRAPDTGRVHIVDTGEVPIHGERTAPRVLKALVGVMAFLVVLGAAALVEHAYVRGWAHDVRASTDRWYHDTESALGITSKPASKPASKPSAAPAHHSTAHTSKVTTTPDPATKSVTIDVAAPSFSVKVVASGAPCWVSASAPGQPPSFSQTLTAGETHSFVVTSSLTIETGSTSARAFIYEGTKLLSSYVPTAVPFHMEFTATG